jgi:vacuolar protein sorting-associated protein 13D
LVNSPPRELAVYYLKEERGEVETTKQSMERKTSHASQDAEFFMSDSSPEEESVSLPALPSTLQQYLPYWVTGYSEAVPPKQQLDEEEGEEEDALPPAEVDANISSLEEELLEFLSDDTTVVPYKDVVFAQIFFTLKQGSVKLFSDTRSYPSSPVNKRGKGCLLFELEFNDTRVEFESRPRTRSYKFCLSLGGMYLRDMITPNSIFPLLISPQNVQGAPLCPKSASRGFGGMAVSAIQSILPRSIGGGGSAPVEEPLFYLLYETRPFTTPKVDYRIHVRSQPLNVVYNPTVIQCVTDFFKIPDELNRLSNQIRSAAINRLEEAKQRTKEELLRNINSILEGQARNSQIFNS